LWIIHDDNHSTFLSSCPRIRSVFRGNFAADPDLSIVFSMRLLPAVMCWRMNDDDNLPAAASPLVYQ